MAIVQFPRREERPGAMYSLASGVGEGIETLIDQKLKDMRDQQEVKKNTAALEQYMDKDKASALGALSVSNPQFASAVLKNELERPYMQQGLGSQALQQPQLQQPQLQQPQLQQPQLQQPQQQEMQKYDLGLKKVRSIKQIRKKLLRDIKKKKTTPEQVKDYLMRNGFDETSINVILSDKADDNVIRYFLSKTDNDPVKAKSLARKFGFRV